MLNIYGAILPAEPSKSCLDMIKKERIYDKNKLIFGVISISLFIILFFYFLLK